ncbi:hypothetical protein FFI89_002300 [Bradyrhizobium sp. KBS0727]|uniref:hypothetical protein n=1 Tax=unclassified Bradyrhizobium TaxID=2631580 RepID=UPI00110D974B|nr:hypothetical protein FFI71_002300 [Bradyrhizobium sp. KBS0725]QDW42672.1 hypothetical protein FFI89_002300 [Bradyrhizobium sp. KBS0727]
MSDMKEVTVIKRRRAWEWQLRDQSGILIMGGREKSRPAARYQGYRALFMLLATSWRQSDLEAPRQPAARGEFRHT